MTRSPLYSIYGETIAGVTVVRAFGASSKYLRDMLRCVDTVSYDIILYSYPDVFAILRRIPIPTIGCGEVSKKQTWHCKVLTICSKVNRWLSARFNLLSSAVVGVTALVIIATPSIPASTAGFALAFASTVSNNVSLIRQFTVPSDC